MARELYGQREPTNKVNATEVQSYWVGVTKPAL